MTDMTITMVGNLFAALSLFVFGVLILRETLRSRDVQRVSNVVDIRSWSRRR